MCEKEELLKKIEELKQRLKVLEDSEYPKYMLYMDCKKHNRYIVKFSGVCTGKVVATADINTVEIGHYADDWFPCTERCWKEVTNPDILCDKDLVECWDNKYTHKRLLKFYDAKNKATYDYEGEHGGFSFENYRKLMPWEYPDWAIEAQKTLAD